LNAFVGGFVPRDPTLDGPYFESSFNSVYHHQTTDNSDIVSEEQAPLPSITEPSKIVENGKLSFKNFMTFNVMCTSFHTLFVPS
jgi:hypothetical protein